MIWKLRRNNDILRDQNVILKDQVFRADYTNQLNELRIKLLYRTMKIFVKWTKSLKRIVRNVQKDFDTLEAFFEVERREHILVTQSLKHESESHKTTKRSLQHERITVQRLIDFLNGQDCHNAKNSINALSARDASREHLNEEVRSFDDQLTTINQRAMLQTIDSWETQNLRWRVQSRRNSWD